MKTLYDIVKNALRLMDLASTVKERGLSMPGLLKSDEWCEGLTAIENVHVLQRSGNDSYAYDYVSNVLSVMHRIGDCLSGDVFSASKFEALEGQRNSAKYDALWMMSNYWLVENTTLRVAQGERICEPDWRTFTDIVNQDYYDKVAVGDLWIVDPSCNILWDEKALSFLQDGPTGELADAVRSTPAIIPIDAATVYSDFEYQAFRRAEVAIFMERHFLAIAEEIASDSRTEHSACPVDELFDQFVQDRLGQALALSVPASELCELRTDADRRALFFSYAGNADDKTADRLLFLSGSFSPPYHLIADVAAEKQLAASAMWSVSADIKALFHHEAEKISARFDRLKDFTLVGDDTLFVVRFMVAEAFAELARRQPAQLADAHSPVRKAAVLHAQTTLSELTDLVSRGDIVAEDFGSGGALAQFGEQLRELFARPVFAMGVADASVSAPGM